MKQTPKVYLSYKSSYAELCSLIWNGSPLCAETTMQQALACADRYGLQVNHWFNGSTGEFHSLNHTARKVLHYSKH